MKTAKIVVGKTRKIIQRWKSWCTKKLVAIMGIAMIKIGVNKQCIAQTAAIPIARWSSQPWRRGVLAFVIFIQFCEIIDDNYHIICKFLSINLCVWTFPQHIKIRALVKDLIQKQAFCRSRHDAVGPLFRFEDLGDVVGREAPAPDSIECTSDAAYHAVKKATAFGI